MIEIRDLDKSFGKVHAVKDVSLTIRDQQIFGLIGTNGAGKSTMLRMLSDVLEPDNGWVHFDGQDVTDNPDAKRDIFFVPDDAYFFPGCTPADMAEYYAGIYEKFDSSRFQELMDFFLLDGRRSIQTYAKGTRRQLSILLGLAASTRYLILDETFDGLDPVIRQGVKAMIRRTVREQGTTAVISSHNLADVEDFCSHITILHEGVVLLSDDSMDQKRDIQKVQCVFHSEEEQKNTEKKLSIRHRDHQGRLQIYIVNGTHEETNRIFAEAEPLFYEFLDLTMEEIFFNETEEAGYDIRKFIRE